ncbi:hypothetical protein ACFWY9_21570 [Amycolatopsis sp. NPDC059027]|uniref:hypothetical protein n=1 Tax=unclassified Amycolatopsis TaxID=2618356 RepID=UPI00366B4168
MSSTWMVVALTSTAAVVVRELFSLMRYLRRRAGIERIATQIALPGTHLVDEDEQGARFAVTVDHCRSQPPSTAADIEQDKAQ